MGFEEVARVVFEAFVYVDPTERTSRFAFLNPTLDALRVEVVALVAK